MTIKTQVRKEHRQLWFRATHSLQSLISWMSGRETVFLYGPKSVGNVCQHCSPTLQVRTDPQTKPPPLPSVR